MAIASLILAIVGLIFSFIPALNWIGVLLGIVAIILGAIGKKKTGSGAATAGLVIGILAVVFGLILYIACVACAAAAGAL